VPAQKRSKTLGTEAVAHYSGSPTTKDLPTDPIEVECESMDAMALSQNVVD